MVLLPGVSWRELNRSGQWSNFVVTATDSIASAPRGSDGSCPPPQSASYVAGLASGNGCVELAISDGGPNDADGQVNGSVQMTGAPTIARQEATATAPTSGQGGAVDPSILLALGALALLSRRRKELK